MNVYLFFTVLALLAAICLWLGKKASLDLKTNEDYFLMGRKLTFMPLCLTLLATQLGGGTLLGAAQEAYTKGWLVFFYPLGASLGLVALGMGFGGKLRKLNISTIAEIFEKIYRSRPQRLIASALSILALFFILIGQAIAARKFFISLGIESQLIVFGFWAVLVIYTVMGGLKAVVNTDVVQALFILFSLALAFFFFQSSGSTLSVSSASVTESLLSDVPWTAWLLMPLLFMFIEQDMAQRCFAAKTPRVVSYSSILAGILLLLGSLTAIFFGVLAKKTGLEIPQGASVLVESIKKFTNPVIATLFMNAILMAIVSTADSLLCSISSNISCDFLELKQVTEKSRVRLSRIITLTIGFGSLALSYFFGSIVAVLMLSYELSVCILFAPIIMAMTTKKPCAIGAYASMGIGALGFFAFLWYTPPMPKEILTILLSFGGYYLVKALKKRFAVKEKVLT